MGAGGYEMSKIFVEKLPVIETHKIDSKLLNQLESLASKVLNAKSDSKNTSALESQIDSLIYQIYGLNKNEINLIESELSTRERERERTEIIENLYHLYIRFCDSACNFTMESQVAYQGKIIWAEMTNTPCFVYDDKGFYINQTCYFIPRDDKYLCAILNSKLIYFYMRQIASNLGDGAFRWIKQYIEKLPIPKLDSKNQKIVNEIITLVDEILQNKAKDKNFNSPEFESKIDNLVYKLYNLTDEEIKIVGGGNNGLATIFSNLSF